MINGRIVGNENPEFVFGFDPRKPLELKSILDFSEEIRCLSFFWNQLFPDETEPLLLFFLLICTVISAAFIGRRFYFLVQYTVSLSIGDS